MVFHSCREDAELNRIFWLIAAALALLIGTGLIHDHVLIPLSAKDLLITQSASPIVPASKILEMKYFADLPADERARAPNLSGKFSEYALVTVDPAAFVRDADTDGEMVVTIREPLLNTEDRVRINLVSVPPPVSADAVIVVKNESGEFTEPLPLLKMYRGAVSGWLPSEATFTVSDTVLLGQIAAGGRIYYLDQSGPNLTRGGEVIHILYRSDKTIPFRGLPEEYDIHLIAGWSLTNLDTNRSHTVHIRLLNATHTIGEEEVELGAGNSTYPSLLTNRKAGTYYALVTVDGNRTSELELIDPSPSVIVVHPNGTVTQDTRIFSGWC